MDDRTMLELAREIADTVCNEIGPVAMCKDPLSFAQEVGVRLIELVKAEENEACAKVLQDNADACGDESIMRHILESQILAIRAMRK